MNIRQLDLNLLLVFDAVYRERSTSAAARKLDLSQPAVSNALRRLRKFTGDTLFFRSGNEMMPTRTANALAIPVSHALSTVEESLSSLRAFDPRTSTRVFRLGINDFMRVTLVPALANLLEQEAPNVRLEFTGETPNPPVLLEALRRGETDISILPLGAVAAEKDISFSAFNSDTLAVVARAEHPIFDSGTPVSTEALASARYVTTNNAPALRALAETVFAEHGIERNVACVMPDTSTIPSIVEMTDYLGIVGKSFLKRHQRDHAIAEVKTPFTFPQIKAGLVWARSADEDQGLQWLRHKAEGILKSAVTVGE
ncbi:LysR family transcriptional regulator [Tepidicaulis sp. LMO-SS28]|uniref:LysR family transcriptional regulator n=1 Tax=Tepidicaulis sp. LMO-SS28 TaxID=3447455 RepID=UPI003EDEBB81